jgi:hypothetical protein
VVDRFSASCRFGFQFVYEKKKTLALIGERMLYSK